MYLDSRLWTFTKGVRLRIAWAVFVGLLAVAVGIARLGLLGWLLGRVLGGESIEAMVLPIALVAGTMLLRGWLDYYRNMVAHRTAAIVQTHLRVMIYNHVTELGPAHFTEARTGDVILSMVEGVEQLEVYFGQYLPQLFIAGLTPVLIFAFVAFVDMPIALALLVAALVTLFAPAALGTAWTARTAGPGKRATVRSPPNSWIRSRGSPRSRRSGKRASGRRCSRPRRMRCSKARCG